jgi:hypothetical protein
MDDNWRSIDWRFPVAVLLATAVLILVLYFM